MLLIAALTVVALVWAYVGRVDVVAVAQGKIQAVGRTKVIQPLETGRVKTLDVENGLRVHAGDVLVELDPSVSEADEATLLSGLEAFDAEVQRRRVANTVVISRSLDAPTIAWDGDIPKAIADREQRILSDGLGQLSASVASLAATVQEKTAEHDRLVATIAAEERLVAVLKMRVDMRATLLGNAAGSKASLLDAQETYETQQTYLASLKGQAEGAAADVEVVKRDLEKSYQTFLADNAQKLADAERQADDAREKLAKAKIVTSHTVLRSPIDGVVQGLTITTVGQVVASGEQIMEIVPQDSGLEIESYLPNQDIGFVRSGDTAVVKIEAFPFTRYGTLDAAVVRVGKDAIPEPEAAQREGDPVKPAGAPAFGGAERMQNLVFPVTLKLAQSTVTVDGRAVPLIPGMAVSVEVKTGSRRILEYLFSPVVEVTSGALRER